MYTLQTNPLVTLHRSMTRRFMAERILRGLSTFQTWELGLFSY